MKRALIVSFFAVLSVFGSAAYTAEAFNNGTIQITGPRAGTNGKNFFNIEGVGNAQQFRSWGAADFHAADFAVGFSVGDVSNFQVILTEANAGFTMPGKINFWLTPDVTNSIDPGTSPFVWQDNVTPDGIGTQAALIALGSGDFTSTGGANSGQVDTFTFTLSPAAKAYVINALNNNQDMRLVITPDSTDINFLSVAATFAGHSNSTSAGPTISFDANVGSATETLAPISEQILLGTSGSGGNLSSWASDDNNLRTICKFFLPNVNSPFIQANLNFTTTKSNPTAVSFNVRVAVDPGGTQQITLLAKNFATNSFANTSVTGATTATNTTYTGTLSGTLTDFVGASGTMQGQIQVKAVGFQTSAFPCVGFDSGNMVVTG